MSPHKKSTIIVGAIGMALIPAVAFADSANAASSQFPDEYFYNCVMDAYYESSHPVKYEVQRNTADLDVVYDSSIADSSDIEETEPIELTEEELGMIRGLYCEGNYNYGDGEGFVRDTSGIELLSNLTYLRLYGNNISSLDLSNNRKLEIVDIPGNNISSLQLPAGHRLWGLKINGNRLQSLDLSNNPGIEVLFLDGNLFSGHIDLTGNYSLQNLYSGDTPVYLGNKANIADDGTVIVDLSNLQDYNLGNIEVLESEYYSVDPDAPYIVMFPQYDESMPQFIEVATEESVVKLWIDFSELTESEEVPEIPDTSGIIEPASPNTGVFTKEDESVKAINIGIAVVAVLSSAFLGAFIFVRVRDLSKVRQF